MLKPPTNYFRNQHYEASTLPTSWRYDLQTCAPKIPSAACDKQPTPSRVSAPVGNMQPPKVDAPVANGSHYSQALKHWRVARKGHQHDAWCCDHFNN